MKLQSLTVGNEFPDSCRPTWAHSFTVVFEMLMSALLRSIAANPDWPEKRTSHQARSEASSVVKTRPRQSPAVPEEAPLAFVSPPAVSSSIEVKTTGEPEVPFASSVPEMLNWRFEGNFTIAPGCAVSVCPTGTVSVVVAW